MTFDTNGDTNGDTVDDTNGDTVDDTNGDTVNDTIGDTVDDTNVTNFSLSIYQLTCHLLIIGANVLQHPNILKAKDVDGLRLVVLRRVNEMYAMPVVWKRLVEIWEETIIVLKKKRRQLCFIGRQFRSIDYVESEI